MRIPNFFGNRQYYLFEVLVKRGRFGDETINLVLYPELVASFSLTQYSIVRHDFCS